METSNDQEKRHGPWTRRRTLLVYQGTDDDPMNKEEETAGKLLVYCLQTNTIYNKKKGTETSGAFILDQGNAPKREVCDLRKGKAAASTGDAPLPASPALVVPCPWLHMLPEQAHILLMHAHHLHNA